ncbi:RND family transporter [Facklamia sp. 7083-14-GEN3]|uniref:efflux RND transporter permease subunit n=1 Tax=Facklamia sp. 7083-14-GEN3 TaxID=2973478 RepID=UPI00215BFC8F|nr:MMPL family transporter [Facklamia sp. 7083-14-GEN3]MCR8969797.1 MMPL family transporter [Facklamia sp. 7083-14-GEN3]
MEKVFRKILQHDRLVLLLFLFASVISLFSLPRVKVNYDMNDYLPSKSPSTQALSVMEEEFEGRVPNARLMLEDLTIPQALEFKDKISQIEGVDEVLWLDDSINITEPLAQYDQELVESYYKNQNALYSITIDESQRIEAVDRLRNLVGDKGYLEGTAVNTAVAAESTVEEIGKIVKVTIPVVLIILIITTNHWFEPVILLFTIGESILLNAGSNLLFGTISFVTSGAGNILLLAVSLDYSVFLLHRFEENRKLGMEANEAMVKAFIQSRGSIASSGLTTGISFAALTLMQFKIGPDLGIALAKGIIISLLTVFILLPILVLKTYRLLEKTKHKPLLPSFRRLGKFVTKVMLPLVAVFSILVVPSFLAQKENDYYYGAEHIFGPETKLGQDSQQIKESFGQSNRMVLLVPKGNQTHEIQLSTQLKEIPEVKDVISYVDRVGAEIPMEYLDEETLSLLESKNYSRMIVTVDSEYEGDTSFKLVGNIRQIADEYYPNQAYLAGESASTYDLMDTITDDNLSVNLLSTAAVFIVLAISFKSIIIPLILVLSIETAVWINLSIPYFNNQVLFYFSYLIVGAIQLGATVDYAILMARRYLENRESLQRKEAIVETVSNVTVSIMTSGSAIVLVGSLLGYITTHGILMQLGSLLAKGSIFSILIVFFVLPGLLYLFDKPIEKFSLGLKFAKEEY